MSSAGIEIQFEKMKETGDTLKQAAENLRQLTEAMGMEIIAKTKAAWISENADIFAGKEIRLMENVSGTAYELDKIAEEMLQNAEKLYQLEGWNTLTARLRSYL